MNEDDASLFRQYRHQGLLVDTNILLLWFVGSVNRARISKFNRTEKFIPEDYDLLLQVLEYFTKIVTTPNILTEVNSLINQLGEPERSQCFSIFAEGITRLEESYLESSSVGATQEFTRFGLTDCGIAILAKERYLVLTDDLKLSIQLQIQGIDAINFNHLRIFNWVQF